jgi:3-deoxy-D-manno-octulosonate 8-phosphate phosphatase (KDO 8-P phosphatase)
MQRKPALEFAAPMLLRAQSIRLLILDVDGVLTDGGLYISEQGESLKRFSVLDGQGLKLLQQAGIEIAVISGRDSLALRHRLEALHIHRIALGTENKLPAAQHMLDQLGLTWAETAVMGDDWPDLPLLNRAQLACAPANGHAENQAMSHFIASSRGGEGAVRELCDLILVAQGHYVRFFEAVVQA